VIDQTPEEAKAESDEDDRNAGCFLQGLGCAGEGCLTAAFPCIVAFLWLMT